MQKLCTMLIAKEIWLLKNVQKTLPEHIGPRSEKLVFNFVVNFRRVTHFRLCLFETHTIGGHIVSFFSFSFNIVDNGLLWEKDMIGFKEKG